MATRDPVGTALASIGAGGTTGAAVMTAGVVVLRALQRGRTEEFPQDLGFTILAISLFGGIAAAAAAGWLRALPIDDLWRRGVIAALSVFTSALVALLATGADLLAGLAGLSAYLAALVVASFVLHATARKAGSR